MRGAGGRVGAFPSLLAQQVAAVSAQATSLGGTDPHPSSAQARMGW